MYVPTVPMMNAINKRPPIRPIVAVCDVDDVSTTSDVKQVLHTTAVRETPNVFYDELRNFAIVKQYELWSYGSFICGIAALLLP